MNKVTVVDDVMVYCPLLKKEIPDSDCYEINSVAFGICSSNLIDNIVTREEAEPICESCENCMM